MPSANPTSLHRLWACLVVVSQLPPTAGSAPSSSTPALYPPGPLHGRFCLALTSLLPIPVLAMPGYLISAPKAISISREDRLVCVLLQC